MGIRQICVIVSVSLAFISLFFYINDYDNYNNYNNITNISGTCIEFCGNNNYNEPLDNSTHSPESEESTLDGCAGSPEPEECYLEGYLEKYKCKAQLIFNPSKKMKVGKTENINAFITRDINKNISEEYRINETLQSRDINITPKVKVTLIGGEKGAFDIEPTSNEVQRIIGKRTTIWSWQVTPLKSGKHTLLLSVEYVIPLNNGDNQDYNTLRNIEETIEVQTSPCYFVECHWQWFVGTLIAIATLIIPMYKQKK